MLALVYTSSVQGALSLVYVCLSVFNLVSRSSRFFTGCFTLCLGGGGGFLYSNVSAWSTKGFMSPPPRVGLLSPQIYTGFYFRVMTLLVLLTSHYLVVCLFSFVVPGSGVYIWCRSGLCLQWSSSTLGLLPCKSYLRVLALLANFFMKGSSKGDTLLTFWGPLRGMLLLVAVYNGTPHGAPAMGDISCLGGCYLGHQFYTSCDLLPCNSYLRVLALLGNFFMKGSSKGEMLHTFWDPPWGLTFW